MNHERRKVLHFNITGSPTAAWTAQHDSPIPRPVESPEQAKVIEMPQVGGLHHHYLRQAA